ncbi:MAG: HypC/HybG/HupF family hydrogenase formation chaperone, partial [Gammaproteobacteria bacterium]
MCLAIPMQIMDIHAHTARCNANGVERSVNLFLMQETP